MADQTITLRSPEGEKYETTSRVEATRLKARGYRESTVPSAPQPSTTSKSDKS